MTVYQVLRYSYVEGPGPRTLLTLNDLLTFMTHIYTAFFLFIDSLWISHHARQSNSSPCPFVSALCSCNPRPQNKVKLKNNLVMEAVVCVILRHTVCTL